MSNTSDKIAYLEIVEQPARNGVRFRYDSEFAPITPIPGVNSSDTQRTYPSVRICDYSGSRAMIVVSTVTANGPYKQHPNPLAAHQHCYQGIYTRIVNIRQDNIEIKIGIRSSKRSQLKERLVLRREMGCDPTNGGFDHLKCLSKDINLKAVRLCFQAYIEDELTGLLTNPLPPVLSSIVCDRKICPSLAVKDISHDCCRIVGAKIMLFCDRIDANDIEAIYYRNDSHLNIDWSNPCKMDIKVHKNYCIRLNVPSLPNYDPIIADRIYIVLRRPSDQCCTEPIVIRYLPECKFLLCPHFYFSFYNFLDSIPSVE